MFQPQIKRSKSCYPEEFRNLSRNELFASTPSTSVVTSRAGPHQICLRVLNTLHIKAGFPLPVHAHSSSSIMKFIGLFASALIASVLANPVLEHGSTETTKAPKAQKTHSSGHHEHKGKHEGKGFPPVSRSTQEIYTNDSAKHVLPSVRRTQNTRLMEPSTT